jgi:hypothetical protein
MWEISCHACGRAWHEQFVTANLGKNCDCGGITTWREVMVSLDENRLPGKTQRLPIPPAVAAFIDNELKTQPPKEFLLKRIVRKLFRK